MFTKRIIFVVVNMVFYPFAINYFYTHPFAKGDNYYISEAVASAFYASILLFFGSMFIAQVLIKSWWISIIALLLGLYVSMSFGKYRDKNVLQHYVADFGGQLYEVGYTNSYGKQGEIIIYDTTEKIISIYHYINDKKNGSFKYYNEDGSYRKGTYKDDTCIEYKDYDRSGKPIK